MSNSSFLDDYLKKITGSVLKKIMVEHPDPELSKEMFIEATTNIKTADALVSLCLVAAASHSDFRIKKFIQEQRLNGDMNFIEALQSIEQNGLLYYNNGNWNVRILNFMGQCLLEADYTSNMDSVKNYQTKIGAKSMFSPNYIAESASIKAQPIIAKKRKRFSQASVVEAGMAMIIHINNLREQ